MRNVAVFRDPCQGHYYGTYFRTNFLYNADSALSMYADDQIYEKGQDMCTVLAKLQESATLATNWYDSNLLQGNLKKYQTMSIRNKSVTCGDKMSMENLKLLGLTIDCGLNFDVHISNVCKKASQRIGVIMRLRNLIPTEAKLHLYKAAILFHLTYCHLVWHFCRASDTRRLERVQERGLIMSAVIKDKLSSYQQLLEKAKLPTLYDRGVQDI